MTEPSEGCPYRFLRSTFAWLQTISDVRDIEGGRNTFSAIFETFNDLHASGYSIEHGFSVYEEPGTKREVHDLLRQVMPLLHEYGRRQARQGGYSRSMQNLFNNCHERGYAVAGEISFADLAHQVRSPSPSSVNSGWGQRGDSTTATTTMDINWVASNIITYTSGTGGGATGESG